MERYVFGIDIGTTAVKTVLISSSGRMVDEATQSHPLIALHTGWAEEDAEIWWENTVRCIRLINERHPEEMKRVECIGATGMVPAIVVTDEAGTPLRNAILQNDVRAVSQIEMLTDTIEQDELFSLTGGYTNQQHVLPRLLWIRDHEPEVFASIAHVFGSYDYINFKLTGVFAVEANWAAESGLFDIRKKCLLTQQLNRFGVDPAIFPPLCEIMHVLGAVTPEAAASTGLKSGIPVISGSADHVASALAAGIITAGDLLIKFGGAGDILYCTDTLVTHERLFFDYHIVPGKYLVNGCMAASGSLIRWFLWETAGSYDKATLRYFDEEAAALPATGDGLIVLPYFLGEKTPLMDPLARGTIFGLTLSHTKYHIYRACLEAVIYGFRHHMDVLAALGCDPACVIASDGGAKSPLWCQISADVLGKTICAYPEHPGSALGVAFLAGMASGAFGAWEDVRLFLGEKRIYQPNAANVPIYDKAYKIYRELYVQLRGCCKDLSRLYSDS